VRFEIVLPAGEVAELLAGLGAGVDRDIIHREQPVRHFGRVD
jgi:hypothetical protein